MFRATVRLVDQAKNQNLAALNFHRITMALYTPEDYLLDILYVFITRCILLEVSLHANLNFFRISESVCTYQYDYYISIAFIICAFVQKVKFIC